MRCSRATRTTDGCCGESSRAGSGWSSPLDGAADSLEPAGDGALVRLSDDARSQRAIAADGTITPLDADVIVGIASDRWAIETSTGERERCGGSIWGSGRWSCTQVVDWAQHVVYRVAGQRRDEVAHVTLYASEYGALWGIPLPLGIGRIGLAGGTGLWAMR